MDQLSQNMAEIQSLAPNRVERIKQWMIQAFQQNWLFSLTRKDDGISVDPLTYPDSEDIGYIRDSNEQVLLKLKHYRLMQLERLGVKHGIYRSPETIITREKNFFEVYNLPLPA